MVKHQRTLVGTPFVLAILDGWGVRVGRHRDDTTKLARLPFFRELEAHYPHALLDASGSAVGLPRGQDGNSEAGHLNLGAGRIVVQDTIYISKSIADGTFAKNSALLAALAHVRTKHSTLHLMGLLSNYNSGHVSPDHFFAILKLARAHKVRQVAIHLFTDGRDSPKYDALKFVHEVERRLEPPEFIATVTGRYYAMDRKKAWTRTERTYNLLTRGVGIADTSAAETIRHAYNRGETDEFISPTVITNARHQPRALIRDHDAVIFFNLRSDRARQLAKPFVQVKFEQQNSGAWRRWKRLKDLCFVALTDFGPDLGNILTAFPSRDITDTLPRALQGYRQLYLAESEKFAQMTYFFNGGYNNPVAGEDRIVVPSPDVPSYDRTPSMAAPQLTRTIVQAIKHHRYDFIGINYANADMVGHTGNLKACVRALEVVDRCLKQVAAALTARHGAMLITADHGNVEETVNQRTGEIDTEHSTNPVPCYLYGAAFRGRSFTRRRGVLGDVAPTILRVLGVPQPKAMTRHSLLGRI